MIEAWFSSSEKTASVGPTSEVIVPRLATYPVLKTTARSQPVRRARRCSSRSCNAIVPETWRDAPALVPSSRDASAAALRRRGSAARPK